MNRWWLLAVILVLVVAGLLALIITERTEARVGQHHWPGEADLEPDGDPPAGKTASDVELQAAVTGLGETREPDERAQQRADALDPADWPDLTGVRDRDPQAPHPWRTQ